MKDVVIVGVGESDVGHVKHLTQLGHHALGARRALDDCGLTFKDVDGLFTAGLPVMGSVLLGEYIGVNPRYSDGTDLGGSSFEVHVRHAAAAIAAGYCEVALITYGSTQWSERSRRLGGAAQGNLPAAEFEQPYGPLLPISAYALAAQRHMYQYGTTSEQLAEIAVSTRKWASTNPNALMRDPITVQDVLDSPMVSSPLHLLDCCLVTDGGGGVVLATRERARDLPNPPVQILGSGEGHTHYSINQMPDLTTTGAVRSGKQAFEEAGLQPKDVGVAEIYDSFTITVLMTLEDLGFCAKGEGGPFVENGRTAPGGSLPMNTFGGGLSYTHPGRLGIFLIIEAVRQLRGQCGPRQVPNAEVAVAHGTGGVLSSQGTLILGKA